MPFCCATPSCVTQFLTCKLSLLNSSYCENTNPHSNLYFSLFKPLVNCPSVSVSHPLSLPLNALIPPHFSLSSPSSAPISSALLQIVIQFSAGTSMSPWGVWSPCLCIWDERESCAHVYGRERERHFVLIVLGPRVLLGTGMKELRSRHLCATVSCMKECVCVCVCARVSVCSKMVFTFLSVATHSLILIYILIF